VGRLVRHRESRVLDGVRQKRAKVDVLADAADCTGFGTEIIRAKKNLWDPEVVRQVAQCEMIFGYNRHYRWALSAECYRFLLLHLYSTSLPKVLKRRTLYIVQEDGFQEEAAMICPAVAGRCCT
jgi:hypothetical protein